MSNRSMKQLFAAAEEELDTVLATVGEIKRHINDEPTDRTAMGDAHFGYGDLEDSTRRFKGFLEKVGTSSIL